MSSNYFSYSQVYTTTSIYLYTKISPKEHQPSQSWAVCIHPLIVHRAALHPVLRYINAGSIAKSIYSYFLLHTYYKNTSPTCRTSSNWSSSKIATVLNIGGLAG